MSEDLSISFSQVEQWSCFELALPGPTSGNPFTDIRLTAVFRKEARSLEVNGFYDGAGIYRLRFMPDEAGNWSYITSSNVPELANKEGTFTAQPASLSNHGPVQVAGFHFRYADGTPYFPIGTTCYAWIHQGHALEEATLHTLANTSFNKVRMCLFPKHYTYNTNEPEYYPFFKKADDQGWDYTRFNPVFFQHLEQRICDLQHLGIEADLILFHPYDHWGFASMDAESDERYLRYTIARLAAYRNLWWSLANEWDFLEKKLLADWERFFGIIQQADPHAHLRSIHNGGQLYNHTKPWVTHASIQHFSSDLFPLLEMRTRYRKPVIIDECSYEGNIPPSWGCLTPQEMVRLCWEGTLRGGYVGHGETYLHPEEILWWSKGGVLHGQSATRITFLKRILEETGSLEPENASNQAEQFCASYFLGARSERGYYMMYTGVRQPKELVFHLPAGRSFTAEIIDTWDMQITILPGQIAGQTTLTLPGKPYTAIRLRLSDS